MQNFLNFVGNIGKIFVPVLYPSLFTCKVLRRGLKIYVLYRGCIISGVYYIQGKFSTDVKWAVENSVLYPGLRYIRGVHYPVSTVLGKRVKVFVLYFRRYRNKLNVRRCGTSASWE